MTDRGRGPGWVRPRAGRPWWVLVLKGGGQVMCEFCGSGPDCSVCGRRECRRARTRAVLEGLRRGRRAFLFASDHGRSDRAEFLRAIGPVGRAILRRIYVREYGAAS